MKTNIDVLPNEEKDKNNNINSKDNNQNSKNNNDENIENKNISHKNSIPKDKIIENNNEINNKNKSENNNKCENNNKIENNNEIENNNNIENNNKIENKNSISKDNKIENKNSISKDDNIENKNSISKNNKIENNNEIENNNIIENNNLIESKNNNIDQNEEIKKEEDPIMNLKNTNRKIAETEIKNSTKIILEEEGGDLLKGCKIEINACGMVGGRKENDGFAIFGQKLQNTNIIQENDNKKNNEENKNNEKIFKPDFELNCDQFSSFPYIFAIYFNEEDKKFYIRAYSGKGSDNKILFIKLTNKYTLILKQKELISVGDIIFQICPMKNGCLEIINLSRKKYMPQYRQIFDGFNNKTVTIGRNKDCNFSFPKDKSFSRYQTTFEFDENNGEWTVIDGNKEKPSTNGTWIFGIHSFVIKEEMIVEILNSKIKITEVKNENDAK